MKTCTKCRKKVDLSCFNKNRDTKDGLRSECRQCQKDHSKKWRGTNPEKKVESDRKFLENNPNYNREYNKVNSARVNAKTRKRQARKLNATPPWLTKDHLVQIQNFYTLAKGVKEMTGKDYHVDHIVPLKGKTVCGLHVPWNLQVIPATENLKKGNKHNED